MHVSININYVYNVVEKTDIVRHYKPANAKWKQQIRVSDTGWCKSKRLEAGRDRFGGKVWCSRQPQLQNSCCVMSNWLEQSTAEHNVKNVM